MYEDYERQMFEWSRQKIRNTRWGYRAWRRRRATMWGYRHPAYRYHYSAISISAASKALHEDYAPVARYLLQAAVDWEVSDA